MKKRSKTAENREFYVIKANDLIRKGRFNLSTQQQKIVLFAISKIKKSDNPQQFYELPITEICNACGLEIDAGGTYYNRIKADMKKLTTRLWVQFPDKSEWTVSWFSDVGIVPLSGTVYVKFHEKLWPYLFDLREKYTQYRLEEVLVFKSKYAIRLFEILRSYFSQAELDNGTEKEITVPVENLRKQLCIEAYPEWKEFNRNVIKKAVDEINQYTEQMEVSYETERTGRFITDIRFIVKSPDDWKERMKRYQNLRGRLPDKRD